MSRMRAPPFLLVLIAASCTGNTERLQDDRAAIERVYYDHRLGTKPPFEETLPPSLIEKLVRKDLRKESALLTVYGVEITSEMLEAEVNRINTTTRAPEMLEEIKTALGNDPVRFANAFAKPFVVERLLREKFENDDSLHAEQRQEMETVRDQMLAAQGNEPSVADLRALLEEGQAGKVTETTWQLEARPEEANVQSSPEELEVKKRFGPDAQLLSSPNCEGEDRKFYFDDLPGQLQRVLRAQLREAGDVSAVIEMPGEFFLSLAEQITDETLRVVTLSLPKRDYHEWLSEQSARYND